MKQFSGKVVFVDGSVNINKASVHSRGSAAAVLLDVKDGLVTDLRISSQYKEGYDLVTNNTMELKAIGAAFMLVGKETKFYLWSDSQYALGCIFGDFQTKKNTSIIASIKNWSKVFKITAIAQHTSGHKGWFMNEAADYVARETVLCQRDINFSIKPLKLPMECALCTVFPGCADIDSRPGFSKDSWKELLSMLKNARLQRCPYWCPYAAFPKSNRAQTSCAGTMA